MIVDIVFGFLGSGKTTFITRVLQEWGDREKIVVLVNEFGEVGIDGSWLKEQGGNVVEMPSGCICCTLQADFRSQLLEILQTMRPQRIIIEPTGVATIAQIRSIVEAQLFENAISAIHYVLIADATGFMQLYRANPHFIESQVKQARAILLNKCDRVERRKALLTRDAISAINPEATVLPTEFGAVDWGQYQLALSVSFGSDPAADKQARSPACGQSAATPSVKNGVHLHAEQDAPGYESFGRIYNDLDFDENDLTGFFQQLSASEMGEIVRAKGIFRVGGKSVLMELASGEVSRQPMRSAAQSRISVIGRKLDREAIGAALERCVSCIS